MAHIRLKTAVPGPRSLELHARRTAAVSAGLAQAHAIAVRRAGSTQAHISPRFPPDRHSTRNATSPGRSLEVQIAAPRHPLRPRP
jgi:hypothetical protein